MTEAEGGVGGRSGVGAEGGGERSLSEGVVTEGHREVSNVVDIPHGVVDGARAEGGEAGVPGHAGASSGGEHGAVAAEEAVEQHVSALEEGHGVMTVRGEASALRVDAAVTGRHEDLAGKEFVGCGGEGLVVALTKDERGIGGCLGTVAESRGVICEGLNALSSGKRVGSRCDGPLPSGTCSSGNRSGTEDERSRSVGVVVRTKDGGVVTVGVVALSCGEGAHALSSSHVADRDGELTESVGEGTQGYRAGVEGDGGQSSSQGSVADCEGGLTEREGVASGGVGVGAECGGPGAERGDGKTSREGTISQCYGIPTEACGPRPECAFWSFPP